MLDDTPTSEGGATSVFAVTTGKGPKWDEDRPLRGQRDWVEHAAFADELVERGVIIVGGPIGGGGGDDVALLAVSVESEAALRAIFATDPWTVNGVFRIKEVRPWTWWLDGRPRSAP
jgi:uncharacterized protein YciI